MPVFPEVKVQPKTIDKRIFVKTIVRVATIGSIAYDSRWYVEKWIKQLVTGP